MILQDKLERYIYESILDFEMVKGEYNCVTANDSESYHVR